MPEISQNLLDVSSFHTSLRNTVAVFPVIPGHSFRIDLTIEVQTIQIGVETSVVPPGACITQSTFATTSFVIITILDGK